MTTLKMGRSVRVLGTLSFLSSPCMLLVALVGRTLVQHLAGAAMVVFAIGFGYWARYKAAGTVTLTDDGIAIDRFGKTRTVRWNELRAVDAGRAHAPLGLLVVTALVSDGWRFTLTVQTAPTTIELVGSDFYDHADAYRALLTAFVRHGLVHA